MWYNNRAVKFVTVAIFWKVVVLMKVGANSLERRSLLSVAEALGLMISFGSLIATIIFGVLTAVKNDKKNNRPL
ncbi:putative holin-like toxin [Enterococcus gallinarum]|uniref:Holin-like toxin n=2 Tax=Enterococcus gallinarum TaxID=1353 RepID=A0ABD4HNE3_ENTGA|nr:putative holin-like toxin [Enterococcus gallinarum]MBA0961514.1 putative holin-like toxin [Enterococcus gallinarum]MBA0969427.1 putative holin-like toxin [Enterococcus gallinarum]MBA0972800.1 putative holin-like toxin [Enterococcus gallinarum]NVI94924.1 putative holin-like toxin [Enterococcus gallinarum]